jgi:two-component system, cell cycle response regulator DivK
LNRDPSNAERVLVIDDNPLNMKLFTALLESQGYAVLQATAGYAGLALARAQKPDLIILDLQLPDLPGLEVAVTLKADEQTRDIPVMAVTAFMADKERDARESGCDGFMTKPVPAAEFLRTVETLLRRVCAGRPAR